MTSNSVEILSTSKGKPSLVINGYQHRLHRKFKETISWLCIKSKKEKCKGSVTTDFNHAVIRRNDHSCIPNIAEIEVKKTMENCKKRVKNDVSIPVSKIFREEFAGIRDKGYDLVAETPLYDNAKTALCRERRKVLGTTENPESSQDIKFAESTLRLPNNGNFLQLDFVNYNGKRVLVFAGEEAKYLLKNGKTFFFDGTFKSCPKQFSQLYTVHVDWNSTTYETNIYPVIYALLPDKTEATYSLLLRQLKTWCPEWNPEIIKLDFEMSAMKAVQSQFPQVKLSGCNFHLNQCLWKKIQQIGLVVDYTENKEVRDICRMCSALAYLPLEFINDAWLYIMSICPKNEKLQLFVDYFVNQWMDNDNIPIELWNVHGQRHRTNNAVEGWNGKLNRAIAVKQPNVQLLVKCLKEDASTVTHNLKSADLGMCRTKRRKLYIDIDERIVKILHEFHSSKNLEKCIRMLSYLTKFD